MRKTIQTLVAAAALALAGCGGEATDEAKASASEGVVSGSLASLRIRGVNGGELSSALLNVTGVQVWADGALIESVTEDDEVDLADTDHAWLLTRVRVPSGAKTLTVTVSFDEGGAFTTGSRAGAIESPCATITYSVPVHLLEERHHAVVHLDLARSLVSRADGTALFVPQFTVHH